MINTSKIPEEEKKVKRSYSYQDIVNLESKNLYSSVGKMINSQKPTAYRATFGKAERKDAKKVIEPAKMAELDNFGRATKGPGAYLPPRYEVDDGKTIEMADPTEKFQYKTVHF